MEIATPQREHKWLQRFVGEWTSETEMNMEPGKPPEKVFGTDSVRSLGGLWILAEGQGDMPCGGPMSMMLTLGRPAAEALRGHLDRIDDDSPLGVRRRPGPSRTGAHAGGRGSEHGGARLEDGEVP